ncbi:MAG: DUF4910 domain-containing protein [Candidatus Hermodarchaeota archaeon]
MDLNDIANVVLSNINGKRAWEWIARISQFNRIQASKGFHQAAELIMKELESLGFEDIELFKFPADGKTKTWGNTHPYQWEIKTGELWVIEPIKEKICDYNETPLSIMTHSKPCDVITEIIDIGKEVNIDDLKRKDVQDKLIMTSGAIYLFRDILEDSGARGIIYYPELERAGKELDKVIYNGLFLTQERFKKGLFGFSISYRQAMRLKELLTKGKVKIHAKIEAEFLEGNLEVLSTSIKGLSCPDEEIILIAHLCHPIASANDNASGSAGLLELARTFIKLVKNKMIQPPNRTLRFLWVPEINGTLPWIKEYEDLIKKSVCCINLDMIGEHRNKIGNPLMIYTTPYSTPSILNDIITFFTKLIADHQKGIAIDGSIAPLSFRIKAYDGGSDHMVFLDSYLGIPSVMINHDDPYYHSSMDTIEFCDSSELKRVIGIAACTAYIFANIDKDSIIPILPLIHEGFYNRIGKTTYLLDSLVTKELTNEQKEDKIQINEKIALLYDLIKAIAEYENKIINSILNINVKLAENHFLLNLKEEIKDWYKNQEQRYTKLLEFYGISPNIYEQRNLLYSSKYIKNYEGILFYRKFIFLLHNVRFKKFSDQLKYNFLGPIHELLNLLNNGFDTLRISSYLSLQYNTILYPSVIQELIDFLVEQEVIKKI